MLLWKHFTGLHTTYDFTSSFLANSCMSAIASFCLIWSTRASSGSLLVRSGTGDDLWHVDSSPFLPFLVFRDGLLSLRRVLLSDFHDLARFRPKPFLRPRRVPFQVFRDWYRCRRWWKGRTIVSRRTQPWGSFRGSGWRNGRPDRLFSKFRVKIRVVLVQTPPYPRPDILVSSIVDGWRWN